jgi:hypothetical protein
VNWKNEYNDVLILEELIHITYELHRSKVIFNNGWIRIWKMTLGLILWPSAGSMLDKLRKTTKHFIKHHQEVQTSFSNEIYCYTNLLCGKEADVPFSNAPVSAQ